MIRFLKDRMSSISSDLYEEILKLNKSYASCIIQIVPCKTALRLISKFMTWWTWQQIITIHILPNISRSKFNQTMKFGQLIEYDMRNSFLEKPYTTCGGEASPRDFYKKKNQNWAYLWIDSLKCYKFVFILRPSRCPLKYTNLRYWPLAFILYKAFFKKSMELVCLSHFLLEFWFSAYSPNQPNVIV